MLGGVAAAAVALGVAQLAAIPFGAQADARTAVGSAVIDLTPDPVRDWMLQTLGSLGKLFLSVVVLCKVYTGIYRERKHEQELLGEKRDNPVETLVENEKAGERQ